MICCRGVFLRCYGRLRLFWNWVDGHGSHVHHTPHHRVSSTPSKPRIPNTVTAPQLNCSIMSNTFVLYLYNCMFFFLRLYYCCAVYLHPSNFKISTNHSAVLIVGHWSHDHIVLGQYHTKEVISLDMHGWSPHLTALLGKLVGSDDTWTRAHLDFELRYLLWSPEACATYVLQDLIVCMDIIYTLHMAVYEWYHFTTAHIHLGYVFLGNATHDTTSCRHICSIIWFFPSLDILNLINL